MAKPVLGIVTTWFERGATHVSLAYIEALKDAYDIRVYARSGDEFPHDDPKWNKPFVHWGEFVPGAPKTFVDWKDFYRWMKQEKVEVLLFNEQQSWDVILRLRKLNRRPLMGAYIDYYTKETGSFFSLYDFLLCNTSRHYSVFENHPGVMYVPWGVMEAEFKLNPRPERPFTFMHSMGYNPYRKGTDLCIEAFHALPHDEVRLVIHAQRDLNEFPELKGTVETDDRITWINKEVPPPGLYHLGDVYVYPSRLDGIGLSLPEALSQGMPAITTDEPPMSEFVGDKSNGWLVEVEKRWIREDGYFWEMTECSVPKLTEAMELAYAERENWEEKRNHTLTGAKMTLDWKKNSASLPERIKQLDRVIPHDELVEMCEEWETAHTPKISLQQKLHRFLIQLGARQLKRRIFGRS